MHRGLARGLQRLGVFAALVMPVDVFATDALITPVYVVAADVLTTPADQKEVEIMRLRQQVAELEQELNASCRGYPSRDPMVREPVWADRQE
jgi:hypothetical protein